MSLRHFQHLRQQVSTLPIREPQIDIVILSDVVEPVPTGLLFDPVFKSGA
jgi:hypothetical protein